MPEPSLHAISIRPASRRTARPLPQIDPAITAAIDDLHLLYQPIVDVEHATVAGYEVLARSRARPNIGFDILARELCGTGRSAFLRAGVFEAGVVAKALLVRAQLPPNVFLSINISPETLALAGVQELFRNGDHLGGVVIELTEHSREAQGERFEKGMELLRSLGARIAVDDAGAGYANLERILHMRPDFVKIDRALVSGVDHDGAKSALIETLGRFANSIDAWIIAEGVEEPTELQRLVELGVPLLQGYLVGRPGALAAGLPVAARRLLTGTRRRERAEDTIGGLLSAAPIVTGEDPRGQAEAVLHATPSIDHVIELDERGRPVGAYARIAAGMNAVQRLSSIVVVHLDDPLADVAERAVARRPDSRWRPLVCVDAEGRFAGEVRVEHLVHRMIGQLRNRSSSSA